MVGGDHRKSTGFLKPDRTVQMIENSSTTMITTGINTGRFTRQKVCHAVAPSTRAASCSSCGNVMIAAVNASTINGVHSQMSVIMMATYADVGWASQLIGWMPKNDRK